MSEVMFFPLFFDILPVYQQRVVDITVASQYKNTFSSNENVEFAQNKEHSAAAFFFARTIQRKAFRASQFGTKRVNTNDWIPTYRPHRLRD